MKELFNMNLSEQTIKLMLEINPELRDMNNNEIINKVEILKSIKCSSSMINNIISSNPLLLNRADEEIRKLINYLLSKGFTTLNILFDSNPYILNLDIFEIDNYIIKKNKDGENLESIIDELDSNPYLFNEM